MAGTAIYRICVRGHVTADDSRRLRGLRVENTVDVDGAPVARLSGELPDQAALMGILQALNSFQLPLLSAEFRSRANDTPDA